MSSWKFSIISQYIELWWHGGALSFQHVWFSIHFCGFLWSSAPICHLWCITLCPNTMKNVKIYNKQAINFQNKYWNKKKSPKYYLHLVTILFISKNRIKSVNKRYYLICGNIYRLTAKMHVVNYWVILDMFLLILFVFT